MVTLGEVPIACVDFLALRPVCTSALRARCIQNIVTTSLNLGRGEGFLGAFPDSGLRLCTDFDTRMRHTRRIRSDGQDMLNSAHISEAADAHSRLDFAMIANS